MPANALPITESNKVYYLAGNDLLTFLHLYDVNVYAGDNMDMSDAALVDPTTYQVILDSCGDNVYLYVNFSGTGASIRDRYLIVRFESIYANEDSNPFYFNEFSTSVYKRYSSDNGDDLGKLRFALETISYQSGYWKESSADLENSTGDIDTRDFDYPVLNIYTTTTGLSRIDSAHPFLTKISTSKYYNVYNTNESIYVDFNYNPVEEYGISYDGASSMVLIYDTGLTYVGGGALAFAFAPITLSTNDPNWEAQWSWLQNMSKEDYEEWLDHRFDAIQKEEFLDSNSSTLNGYTDFVDSNQDRPNIDMNYLLNLDNIGSLSSGIASFAAGSAPLFQDSAFFNIFPIIAAPPLVISYLLFGKKG